MKRSKTGKPLCCQCRRLATCEGNYYRTRTGSGPWQPARLYYCDKHAEGLIVTALPIAALEAALLAISDHLSSVRLCGQLNVADVPCSLDTAQMALCVRYPERFNWPERPWRRARLADR